MRVEVLITPTIDDTHRVRVQVVTVATRDCIADAIMYPEAIGTFLGIVLDPRRMLFV